MTSLTKIAPTQRGALRAALARLLNYVSADDDLDTVGGLIETAIAVLDRVADDRESMKRNGILPE